MNFKASNEHEESSQNGNKQIVSQDQKSLCTEEKLALSSWGLPEKVYQHYLKKGIDRMFMWQLECLTTGKVLEGGNLVYTAPTSAGKTLVAEILITQTIFERQRKVILILPFVSVVREKMFYFQDLFSSSGIKVEGFMGGHSPSVGFRQAHMAVCTIEKANSIVNRLLEDKDLNSVGLVVVDELHLLGDPYRGYLLELLLTKLKYISSKLEINIQMVGMSATLPNLKVIADWLKADIYYSSYRPVPLAEMMKCGNCLYDKKMNKLKEIVPLKSVVLDLPDHIGHLCLETIANGHSVLIFCPSKAWCENLADEIALFFKRHGCDKSANTENTPGFIIRSQLNLEKIHQVLEHLKMTPVGIDADLQRAVSFGVAFHHAGLTLDERDIIEGSFRNGSIRVLCATSTLASGVNLPARRVIIRTPMAFGAVMDVLTYRQMIGRAGRMGVDSEGESIIICKDNEKIVCQKLMAANLKPIASCLGHGPLSSSLKRALLEIISSGMASTPEEIQEYANCTFLAMNDNIDIENPIQSCITFLEENEFIRLHDGGRIYVATPLGQACLASSLPPDEGLSLFRELQRARRCFVLDTDLHIIYQVTPYSVSEQWIKLDWLHVLSILENLPENMKRVGEMIGVEESFLVRIAKGVLNPNTTENRIKLSIHRRFYTALALQDLVNEKPLAEVAEKYQCSKGTLQSLQQSSATYAGMVTEFTRRLGWENVELIFCQFQERLQFGVHRELVELMRLPLLNVIRARALYNAGYPNLVALANANVFDLENILYSVIPFQSKKEIGGETSFERDQRNKQQTLWITGKADLSVRQAAELLIQEARNTLKLEIGVESANWSSQPDRCAADSSCEENDDSNNSTIKRFEDGNTNCKESDNGYNGQQYVQIVTRCDGILDAKSQIKSVDISHKSVEKEECNRSEISNSVLNNFYRSFYQSRDNIKQCKEILQAEYLSPVRGECTGFSVSDQENFKLSTNRGIDVQNVNKSECKESKNQVNINKDISFTIDKSYMSYTSDVSNINHVAESDTDSNCSEGSVEVLFENPSVHEVQSECTKVQSLSEDMFIIEERDSAANVEPHESLLAPEVATDESKCDLFSQSLTFDTQFQNILDFDVPKKRETIEIKRASSFHSDDLGFVSDCSPPKVNKVLIDKEREYYCDKKSCISNNECVSTRNIIQYSSRDPDTKGTESKYMKDRSQTTKRKLCISDSPDFIIDSDDSIIGNRPLEKKLKASGLINDTFDLKITNNDSCAISSRGVSDDEIMPTPKPRKGRFIGKKSCTTTFIQKEKLSQSKVIPDSCEVLVSGKDSSMIDKNLTETKIPIIKTKALNSSTAVPYLLRNKCYDYGNLFAKIRWDKVDVTDVTKNEEVLTSFREELNSKNIVGLALGCRRIERERKSSIGLKIMKRKVQKPKKTPNKFQYKDMVLEGIAVYIQGSNVYYLPLLDKGEENSEEQMFLLREIFTIKKLFRLFDAKEQIKLLYNFTTIFFEGDYEDPKTACWLLSKTWKEKSFPSIVADYVPEATKLTAKLGPILGYSGPGIYVKSSIPAQTRACIEAFLSFHVVERQLKLLQSRSLLKMFKEVEMPLIPCLAEMELNGFKFDRNLLAELKETLQSLRSDLSEKAYSYAQYKFSLTSSLAIRKVIYHDLRLKESCITVEKKRKSVTNKEALEALAMETNHPLPDIILQWRKIQFILTKVLAPLLQNDSETSRLFSVTQTYTATGRLAMHEPNLQNIPKNFTLNSVNIYSNISVRNIFLPSTNCLLLSVDYCQIELRLLAHLSGDKRLIETINKSADVFVTIASNIYDVSECCIDDELRQKAKQTCYGIIYGIGPHALSHQLRVEESVAQSLMDGFKNRYTGVKKYLEKVILSCKEKGYVTSLYGRRRYLTGINDSNPSVKNESERQAINTTIQGSAADIIKIAMIKIRDKIKDLNKESKIANLLLHLHDELLFEIDEDYVQIVAAVIKDVMENAVKLTVPTPIKMYIGPAWGQLQLYEI